MADVTLTYKGNPILEMSASGSKSIDTAGFYCDANILLNYVKSGGGGVSLDDLFNAVQPTGDVLLSTATRIPDTIFQGNALIQSVSAPVAKYIGGLSFRNCTNLKTVTAPNVEKVIAAYSNSGAITPGTYTSSFYVGTFIGCHNLELIHFPKATYIGAYAFDYVGNSLSTGKLVVVLPSVTEIFHMCFRKAKLKAVDIGSNCVKIWNDAFYNTTCGAVILRSTSLVTAATRDAVRGITNLYVPSALISSYQTASGWVTDAANRTVNAIEGSIYENSYADGTPIT